MDGRGRSNAESPRFRNLILSRAKRASKQVAKSEQHSGNNFNRHARGICRQRSSQRSQEKNNYHQKVSSVKQETLWLMLKAWKTTQVKELPPDRTPFPWLFDMLVLDFIYIIIVIQSSFQTILHTYNTFFKYSPLILKINSQNISKR